MKNFLCLSVAAMIAAFLPGLAPAQNAPATASAPVKPMAIAAQIAGPGGVVAVKLANGMAVIIKPTGGMPVATVRAYVHAGTIFEGRFLGGGISHLAEHLVASEAAHNEGPAGTAQKQRKGSRIDQIGGQSNAYTTEDHTAYFISAAASRVMDCVDLVAEWMKSPVITKDDFEREHGVVQRELEMSKDVALNELYHAEAASLYGSHPAGVPTIGFPKPLAALTYEDLQSYHRRMYIPQNMVFVVVGDVDAPAVLKRICANFAGFDKARQTDFALPRVQPLVSVRRTVMPHEALKETLQAMSFLSVSMTDSDMYPLDMLATILTEGESSRLVQKVLREKQLVTGVDSSSHTPSWGRGYFSILFHCDNEKADAAEKAILGELRAIIEKGVTPDELDRAKRQMVAAFVRGQQTVDSQAATLATDYLFTGDLAFSKNYTRRIQDVTAEQVRQAAKKYLTFDAMTVTRAVPAKSFAPAKAGLASTTMAATEVFFLPNGLRVVLRGSPGGLVSMVLATKGGLLLEDEKTNGMASLMMELSTKGAGTLTADDIAEFFDRAGGAVGGQAGNNSSFWQATVLEDSFDKALDIFAQIVQHPTFPQKELKIVKPLLLAKIDQIDQNWNAQLLRFFRREFFGGVSPYAMLPSGSKGVIAGATPAALAAWHREHVKAGDSVLAIHGSFDVSAARKRIEKLFAEMPAGKVALPRAGEPKRQGTQLKTFKTNNVMAGIMIGVPGMKVDNLEDRIPLDVLDTIISGWQMPSGWLHEELRGKQLVYVVHAANWPGLAGGMFYAYASCQPANANQVIGIMMTDLKKAAAYTPTQDEINEAVNVILTAELLDAQAVNELAMSAALDELYGLGHDYRRQMEKLYRKVTPQDVARVAKKYLSDGYLIGVTTPQPDAVKAPAEGEATKK